MSKSEAEWVREHATDLDEAGAHTILEGHLCACMGPPPGVDSSKCRCALWQLAAQERLGDE